MGKPARPSRVVSGYHREAVCAYRLVEVPGMDIGPSKPRRSGLRFGVSSRRRGLRGVNLVISDGHDGIKVVVTKVLNVIGSAASMHPMRSTLAHAGKSGCLALHGFIATAFAQNDEVVAKARVAQDRRSKAPTLPWSS
jgi:putative transposase